MSVLGDLLDFATISLAVYTLWKHRHDRVWQACTLAILAGLYFLLVPHWLRGFSAVH